MSSDSTTYVHLLPLRNVEYPVEEFLRPAEIGRAFFQPHFYRCLPMSAANSIGWTLFNPYEFSVVWDGREFTNSVVVECEYPHWVQSWFGFGTFTIRPLFLLETSSLLNIWVRSVPNFYKLGVLTMEGIIETDWLKSSFTLNFKLMFPLTKVHFAVGEPLVTFVPYSRSGVETIETKIITEGEAYDTRMQQYEDWLKKRHTQIHEKLPSKLDYLRGIDVDGDEIENHKKTFKMFPFKR